MTNAALTTRLLPVMQRSLEVGFNVFDVMHHGSHEKQLSNVFRWLLEIGGTHNFEALGQQTFVGLLNLHRMDEPPLPLGAYTVRQEVNTAGSGEGGDIADIVLENDAAVIVIENYETSDGHGHGYERYLQYGLRCGKTGVVVLLCATEDRALQRAGWEKASVVTYEQFLDRLILDLNRDPAYAKQNADQHAFISQMHRKYAKEKGRMSDKDMLDFVAAMCATGEAKRYQEQKQDVAAERFASDLAQQARQNFMEGRETLQRVKTRLRSYGSQTLTRQLNESLGRAFITKVSTTYQGIYQWTINFETSEVLAGAGEARLQIKFGPSAWFANEQDKAWTHRVPSELVDYSRLFLTRAKTHEVRQSGVSLHEVLNGFSPDDTRLHDEILALIQHS